jgi:uncharacterized protein YbgA (DUF1722 family)
MDKIRAQRTIPEAQRTNSDMPNGHIIGHLREYPHENTYNTYKSVGLLLFLLFVGLSRPFLQLAYTVALWHLKNYLKMHLKSERRLKSTHLSPRTSYFLDPY